MTLKYPEPLTESASGSTEQSEDQAVAILLRQFEEARARNPKVSLRSFALRLGLSSGALSEIFKGKRVLSNALKKRIVGKLTLSPKEALIFFHNDLPAKLGLTQDDRLTLSQDQFRLISDWWYFALLNLVKTKGFKNQRSWMARRLGLSITTVQEAWERLLRLGYLEKKGMQVVRRQPNIKTSDGLLDLSVRKAHLSDLSLIEKSIHEVPLELRDNTSCYFVIDKADLPKAKEFIRIFQSQFLQQFGRDSGEEVYKMTVALFPLTKVTGDQ